MFKFGRGDFPTKIFIIISILSLFFVGLVFFIVNIFLFADFERRPVGYLEDYNNSLENKDPFITKVPQLKDLIDGPIINGLDPVFGNENAKINIVYFSDFECEFCQKQEKILQELVEEYNGEINLIRKDFPEINKESTSWQASIAGRCAQEQGEFWKYHDLIYNYDLENIDYLEIADELNLKKGTFKDCLEDEENAKLVEDNILEAEALDVIGIPFIFINDQEIMGEVGYEDLKEMIDKELE